jgi:uncharacterized protein
MIVEDQSEVLVFLSDPAAYGPGVTSVERIDTHSASVFLAGDRAYKLKRAVRYDYLDFSTLERRRAACLAEVRLNRRTAPALYLGVVPVTRQPGAGLELRGEGPPVEWLVEMRRFDQEMLLDRMASRADLPVSLMRDLGGAIARFHECAEPAPEYGGRDGIARVIDGNTASFRELGPAIFEPDARDRLHRAAHRALDGCADLLDQRRRAGLVRWCHGDLHLRNICLLDGTPTLFDAIEFNEDIACIDVLYDLAFLLMDLERRQFGQHANVLLNEYLQARDDLAGLPALPLLLSCRAAVRAKTSATAAGLQTDPRQAERLRGAAREYLDMAADLLHPPPPRLVAVGGLSGSGKSSVAAGIAREVGAVPGALIVRSDVLRKAAFGMEATRRLPPEAYRPEVTRRVYEQLCERARCMLAAGHSAIADAVFGEEWQRQRIEEIAQSAGASFSGIWLDASPDTLLRRTRERAGDVSDATPDIVREQLGRGAGEVTWQPVDASADLPTVCERVLAVLADPVVRPATVRPMVDRRRR